MDGCIKTIVFLEFYDCLNDSTVPVLCMRYLVQSACNGW